MGVFVSACLCHVHTVLHSTRMHRHTQKHVHIGAHAVAFAHVAHTHTDRDRTGQARPGQASAWQGREKEAERQRDGHRRTQTDRDKQRETDIDWLRCCTLCLGACAALLHRGGGAGGLTWTVTPGEPARFPQQCLSLTSAAVCLSGPVVPSAPPDP